MTGEDSAEIELLGRLRARRSELEGLLARCSDHWGYEDPIYRFYHQSFKVFYLQQQTMTIVSALAALAPARALNEWFTAIVHAGTGKEFGMEDNARWAEVTRPMLEPSSMRASSWRWPFGIRASNRLLARCRAGTQRFFISTDCDNASWVYSTPST